MAVKYAAVCDTCKEVDSDSMAGGEGDVEDAMEVTPKTSPAEHRKRATLGKSEFTIVCLPKYFNVIGVDDYG